VTTLRRPPSSKARSRSCRCMMLIERRTRTPTHNATPSQTCSRSQHSSRAARCSPPHIHLPPH
jgi:hypothetical protein